MIGAQAFQLQAILDLAADHVGCPSEHVSNAVPEYCTTNRVFTIGSVVAKNYQSIESYEVESAVLDNSSSFTFRTPSLVFSYRDETVGCWNLISRINGSTLASSIPSNRDCSTLIERMIGALVEFEQRAPDLIPLQSKEWLWQDAIAPLVLALERQGKIYASEALLSVASDCQHVSERVAGVPCFDLFPRNIIWSGTGQSFDVSFIDFDKACRLVPSGEQLSHLFVLIDLRRNKEEVITRYASLSNRPLDTVRSVVEVACFFRALGHVRDSLPQQIYENGSMGRDPHATERQISLRKSIAEVERFIDSVSMHLSSGMRRKADLRYLLATIQELEDPKKWR